MTSLTFAGWHTTLILNCDSFFPCRKKDFKHIMYFINNAHFPDECAQSLSQYLQIRLRNTPEGKEQDKLYANLSVFRRLANKYHYELKEVVPYVSD